MPGLGRTMMVVGGMLFAAGLLLHLSGYLFHWMGRVPWRLGHLPGDFVFRGKHTTFYLPLATCFVLSLLFSLLLAIFRKR